jgi:hypothetical protein
MAQDLFRFTLTDEVPLPKAEDSLRLALLAAEGLYGQAQVRLGAEYRIDEGAKTLTLDAGTPEGSAVTRMLAQFLARQFGDLSFAVRRLGAGPSEPAMAGVA